jgi:hypothetical protein
MWMGFRIWQREFGGRVCCDFPGFRRGTDGYWGALEVLGLLDRYFLLLVSGSLEKKRI